MKPQEKFHYLPSPHIQGVKMLSAVMKEFTFDRHAHEEYTIGITRKGRQDFFCRGANYKSHVGQMFFFNPEEVHDGNAGAGQVLEYDVFYLPADRLEPMIRAMGVDHPNHLRLKDSLISDPLFYRQVMQFGHVLQSEDSTIIEQEAGLIQIAESVARLNRRAMPLPFPTRRKDRLLLQAKDFIHDNLEHNLSIDDMSQAANISKYHFIRLFREQFGITPHQYILNCRINQIRRVVESGEKITDIAFRYGFSDVSHLNRKFKKVFGMTPKQYQRQLMYRR
ncbi:AraC family transcriptional regulator [Vibrio quintilis]|uniref:Multiple antibiotic resistance protein MarA n=1 Tax=Vibrio quintilis TaxID=1117707 RepID=A0A1M7YQW0_9VIBR|nr:AraC family transcriptional regulator [Vibrio quintilis]SHO54987.1 Multiple antibiotic resistance protein MarA [Vibrio quintilis]